MAGTAILGADARKVRPRVGALRLAIVAAIVIVWELVSASGLLYRDVVPSIFAIGGALATTLSSADFYRHLSVTLIEISAALALGGSLAIATFEEGPTPNHIIMMGKKMIFGVGPR